MKGGYSLGEPRSVFTAMIELCILTAPVSLGYTTFLCQPRIRKYSISTLSSPGLPIPRSKLQIPRLYHYLPTRGTL